MNILLPALYIKMDYSYQLTESSTLVDFRVNDNAKQEVSDLYDIFNS